MPTQTAENKPTLKREDILHLIKQLACSQGVYCRLLSYLRELEQADPDAYDRTMAELEGFGFETDLDFILWYEC